MTSFATLIPPVHALYPVVEKKLGKSMNWEPRNDLQSLLVTKKDQVLALVDTLNSEQLMSAVSNICEEVNRFLRDNGFPSVQLTDQGSTRMLYVASVLKLLGRFYVPGEVDYHLEAINKPAFRLPDTAGVIQFKYGNRKVLVVPTGSNFSLVVTEPTGVTGFDMLGDWDDILHNIRGNRVDSNGAVLPMVKIEETSIDVSELVGMSSVDPYWVITQALMAAKFSLTPQEVKFEAAFSAAMRKGGVEDFNRPEKDDYVADHPLYFALVRSGHYMPLVAGLVDVKDLSNIVVR